MKVLGWIEIGHLEQHELVDGATLCIGRRRFDGRFRSRPLVGDLMWVKEPYWLYTSHFEFGQQNIHEVIPGPVLVKKPAHLVGIDCRKVWRSARTLERADSRTTLEILELPTGDDDVRCRVHLHQVDSLINAKAST